MTSGTEMEPNTQAEGKEYGLYIQDNSNYVFATLRHMKAFHKENLKLMYIHHYTCRECLYMYILNVN